MAKAFVWVRKELERLTMEGMQACQTIIGKGFAKPIVQDTDGKVHADQRVAPEFDKANERPSLGTSAALPGRNIPVTIREATPEDVPHLVRALLEGVETAYRNLPGSEVWVPRLVANMAGRKPQEYAKIVEEMVQGKSTRKVFTAVADDNRFAGFIEAGFRADGAGQLYSWHLLADYHRTGISRELMRKALEYLGDVDVYSGTTKGTTALPAHQKVGFEEDTRIPEDDPRRKVPGLWLDLGCPPRRRRADPPGPPT